MSMIDERISKAKENVERLERRRRAEQRLEREAQKKRNQRRNYIIGELVVKYFPEVLHFEPGTKAENIIEFELLECFLLALAADRELVTRLKEKAKHETVMADGDV